MSAKEKPLISFCLFAYNQERYIREAVEGAFSQTYSPLEIILSDDCSTDRTFSIMKEMAEVYNGPSKITLNRNEENLELAEHINKIVAIANGEWLVFAAGDDISSPDRTVVLYNLIKPDDSTYYAGSGVIAIDEHGKFIQNGVLEYNKIIMLSGCMAAYHRKCFDTFERLHPNIKSEDFVLPYRALLLGNIMLINSPLVKYRVLTNDFLDSYRKYAQFQKSLEYVFLQRNEDLRKMAKKYPHNILETLMKYNDKYLQIVKKDYVNKKLVIDIYDAPFLKKIKIFMREKSISRLQKIKIFLLSYKVVRILQKHYRKFANKTKLKPFNHEKMKINLNDLINRKIIIQAFNDIDL